MNKGDYVIFRGEIFLIIDKNARLDAFDYVIVNIDKSGVWAVDRDMITKTTIFCECSNLKSLKELMCWECL